MTVLPAGRRIWDVERVGGTIALWAPKHRY